MVVLHIEQPAHFRIQIYKRRNNYEIHKSYQFDDHIHDPRISGTCIFES
jgi:hypothetical protein